MRALVGVPYFALLVSAFGLARAAGLAGLAGLSGLAGLAGVSALHGEPSAHADDVADYVLQATLDPIAHVVHGDGTIVWRNKSRTPVNELFFHLYLNAFKNERSAFFRERIGGRGSSPPEDWGWIDVRRLALRQADLASIDLWPAAELHSSPSDEDETDVRVPLPGPVAAGQEITLEVTFDDKLPAIVERTGYQGSFHMIGQWFPKIARLEPDGRWAHFAFHHLSEFYADFGTYDVTLDVPAAFTVGATGPVVDAQVRNGRRVERHVQHDVHDFAWTAWDRFLSAHATIDGVSVTLLYPPDYARLARRELAVLEFALPYYSSRYGAYPYEVLTVVHPPHNAPEAGGMEYPTLITTGGAWWIPPGILEPEIVTAHELAHQWFYGIVATNELVWPVLDEGLTQFAEVDAMAKWRGEGSLIDALGLKISDAAVQAVGGNMGVHDEPVAQPANTFSSGASYGRLVYARTAAVLETCARVYGDQGVAGALGVYARRHRFEHPAPEDLIAAFAEVMGPEVASTLRAALFDKGWVDYLVDDVSTHKAERPAGVFDRDHRRERVQLGTDGAGQWENSVLLRRRGTLSFPVDVELVFSDGSTRRQRWSGAEEWKRLEWQAPTELRSATIDPDDRVLVDLNRGNNFGSSDSQRAWASRTLERTTYWLQLALQALSP